jgi:hypothetical protein
VFETELLQAVYLPVESIVPAFFNPPIRTSEDAIAAIEASMREHGFHPAWPLKQGNDGRLADGHRRHMAAMRAGIKMVPVIIIKDMTSEQIWSFENGTTRRNIRPAEYAQAVAAGLDLKYIPTNIARKINHLVEMVDIEGLQKLAKEGKSPDVWTQARAIARYCEDSSPDFMRACLTWIITSSDGTMRFRQYRAMDGDPDALRDIVLQGKRLVISIHGE